MISPAFPPLQRGASGFGLANGLGMSGFGMPGLGGDPYQNQMNQLLVGQQQMNTMMMMLSNALWMSFMARLIQALGQSGGGGGVGLPAGSPGFGGSAGGGPAVTNFLGSSPAAGGSAASGSGPVPTGPSGPMGPGVQGALDKARSMLGLQEGRDRAKIQEVTGKSGINPATTPWCAAFAMNILKDSGVLNLDGLSNRNYCPTIVSWAKDKGIWGPRGSYQPKPGDAIMFDWQGDGTSDHIGIVEKVEGGKVIAIEGNSSNSVKRNTYDLGSAKIQGYVIGGKPHRR